VSARSFEIVARQSKAKYVTGLSATVTRKDGHHPIIFMNCGPVRFKLDHREQAASRPFIHRVVTRYTGFKLAPSILSKENLTIQEMYSLLVTDENRNNMIIEDVIEALGHNRSPVILSERREHLECLADRLRSQARNVILMKGGMGKKQRSLVLKRMESVPENDERIILATGRYLGEGFDDARLDTLFLTLPISWRGTLAQYAGRLHRSYKTKTEVIIYDYADLSVPMLSKMYERRCKGYKSIGYDM